MKKTLAALLTAIALLSGCLAPELPDIPEVNSDYKPPVTTVPQALATETNAPFTSRRDFTRLNEPEFEMDELEIIEEEDFDFDFDEYLEEETADLFAATNSSWYKMSRNYNFPVLYADDSLLSLSAYAASILTNNSFLYCKYQLRIGSSEYAVNNLMYGEAEIALADELTYEQKNEARDVSGFTLGEKKIGYAGLVFITDPTNKIENITSDHLRRIYSGEITNWAQVGGNDRAITAYQQNDESSAQFFMEYEVMGYTPLMNPTQATVFYDDEEIKVPAEYKNLPGSLGFCIYSPLVENLAEAGIIKVLSVDGVNPSPETFEDGSYPLLTTAFAYYNASATSTDGEKLAEWFLSKEGQEAVVKAGYYPASAVGDLAQNEVYRPIGTGKEKPAGNAFPAKYAFYANLTEGGIDFLSDKALTNEINAWIARNSGGADDAVVMSTIINGYLSVAVISTNYDSDRYNPTAVWDIIEKKKIKNYTDLFYKDTDFSLTLAICTATALEEDFAHFGGLKKTDFAGGFAGEIEEDGFNTDSLTLYGETAYFTDRVTIDFALLYDYNSVVSEYRNFDDELAENELAHDEYFSDLM
jgi:ABC-type phosphate transport system substrate-binding protein